MSYVQSGVSSSHVSELKRLEPLDPVHEDCEHELYLVDSAVGHDRRHY